MPRPPRVQAADVVYHVTSRGVRGEPIYVDNQDRKVFLSLLDEAVGRYVWQLSERSSVVHRFHPKRRAIVTSDARV